MPQGMLDAGGGDILLPIDDAETAVSRLLQPMAPRAAAVNGAVDALVETALVSPPESDVEPLLPDSGWLAQAAQEIAMSLGAWLGEGLAASVSDDEIDPVQILRDRPDVHAGFYREFYGPSNDRNSPAWVDRVGGETPEDYARYWYKAHGRFEGYEPGSGVRGALEEVEDDAPVGRTTLDGIPLSRILADRPDVFQAFFTEYYGPGNDRHSDAWIQRVGGATVEDYANYWYNAHGRVEGYTPSRPPASQPEPEPGPVEATEPAAAGEPSGEAPPVEDPSLDPWNHPAIYPDWQPPFPGWRPPSSDVAAEQDVSNEDGSFARLLALYLRGEGLELRPATAAELAQARTLFEDSAF